MLAAIAAVDVADRARPARRLHELPQPGAARQAGRHDRRDQRRPVRPRPRRRLERDRVPGLRLPVRPPGRPLRGGVHDHPDPAARRRHRLRRPLVPGPRLRAAAARPAAGRPAADDRLERARGCCGATMAARRRVEQLVHRLRQPARRRRARSAHIVDDGVPRGRPRPGRGRAHRRRPGPAARRHGPAIQGDSEQDRVAAARRATRRAWPRPCAPSPREGIAHVQLVLDPITRRLDPGRSAPSSSELDRARLMTSGRTPADRRASSRPVPGRRSSAAEWTVAHALNGRNRRRASSGRGCRRGLGARQADHRAPPGRRPSAVHPDRRRPRRLRGGRPRPDQPAHRARHPAGRRRDRPAQARLPADGDDRDPLRERQAHRGRRAPRRDARGRLRRHHRRHVRPADRDGLRGQRGAPASSSPSGCGAIDGVRDTETFVYLRLVKQTYQYGTR